MICAFRTLVASGMLAHREVVVTVLRVVLALDVLLALGCLVTPCLLARWMILAVLIRAHPFPVKRVRFAQRCVPTPVLFARWVVSTVRVVFEGDAVVDCSCGALAAPTLLAYRMVHAVCEVVAGASHSRLVALVLLALWMVLAVRVFVVGAGV